MLPEIQVRTVRNIFNTCHLVTKRRLRKRSGLCTASIIHAHYKAKNHNAHAHTVNRIA